MPLPKILVTVAASGLVKVRSSIAARIAVVNKPRLTALRTLDPRTAPARAVSATRFIKRAAVAERDLIASRDSSVRELSGAPATGTASVARRTTFLVPVTQTVRVEATSADEARRLALEEVGLEESEAQLGTPTPAANTTNGSV